MHNGGECFLWRVLRSAHIAAQLIGHFYACQILVSHSHPEASWVMNIHVLSLTLWLQDLVKTQEHRWSLRFASGR